MELIDWKHVTDGDLTVLIVLGQLKNDVSGDSGAGSDDVQTHLSIDI